MSQLEEDCAKYLKTFISNFKRGIIVAHDWNDCHMTIFSEFYPEGWFELRFKNSQQRTQYLESNKLNSNLFDEEHCLRVKNCMEYFPTFLEKLLSNEMASVK